MAVESVETILETISAAVSGHVDKTMQPAHILACCLLALPQAPFIGSIAYPAEYPDHQHMHTLWALISSFASSMYFQRQPCEQCLKRIPVYWQAEATAE